MTSARVSPLGVFGPASRHELTLDRDRLLPHVGEVSEPDRSRMGRYLRGGAVVLALMEYTIDVIDGSFGVSGGSAILSDGRYYWRFDAADYVETHGIGPGLEAVDWMRSQDWRSPQPTGSVLAEIDGYLFKLLSSDAG